MDDGARTRDSQGHNLVLCQLSYIHRFYAGNTGAVRLTQGDDYGEELRRFNQNPPNPPATVDFGHRLTVRAP